MDRYMIDSIDIAVFFRQIIGFKNILHGFSPFISSHYIYGELNRQFKTKIEHIRGVDMFYSLLEGIMLRKILQIYYRTSLFC